MLRVLTLSTLFPDATRPDFGVFVERQAQALAAREGVSLTVVAPVGLPPAPFDGLRRYRGLRGLSSHERWRGLDVRRPRFTVLPGTGGRWHAAALTRALMPVLAGLRFDVIDASFFFPDGPAAVALGARFGVPVSIKARGADIHHWGRASATATQVRAAGLAADGLLAVSEAMKADMVGLGLPADRIAVHRTGIDHRRFAPSVRRTGTAPHIVSVGALIPRKGHDIVLAAVARLPGVALTIAGEGPERERLAATIARLGVADRIRLAGQVPHHALPALLGSADVLALASASEGLANVWVEALACGTPVVATDVGGAREVLTLGAGRIVAREAGAFAEAIAGLLAAPPATATVCAAAAPFDWRDHGAQLHAHLAGLVAAHASSG